MAWAAASPGLALACRGDSPAPETALSPRPVPLVPAAAVARVGGPESIEAFLRARASARGLLLLPLMLAVCLTAPTSAQAGAWLVVCDEAVSLDHRPRVNVADAPSSDARCRSLPLPVAAKQVLWASAAPRSVMPGRASAFSAAVAADGLHDVALIDVAPAPPRPVLAPGADLLAGAAVRTFGTEERVRVDRSESRLRLVCDAGTRPAGAVLAWPAPRSGRAAAIGLRYRADARFELADATGRAGGAEPRPLRGLDPARRAVNVPLVAMQAFAPLALALICPSAAATLTLDALGLVESPLATQASRAAWLWSADRWQQRRPLQPVLAQLDAFAIDTVYVALPASLAALPRDAKRRFVDHLLALRRHGLRVWAVIGDPAFVLPEGRVAALALVDAAIASALPIDGIQLDIEPYLLPGYDTAPELAQRAWAESVIALAQRARTRRWLISAVVPFWWAPAEAGAALDAVGPVIAELVVMDYRTDPDQIIALAEPFLDWGAAFGIPVRIALERGPFAMPPRTIYRRADAGPLWIVSDGDRHWAIGLKSPATQPAGSDVIRVYAATPAPADDASQTTFAQLPAELARVIPEVERRLAPWTAYRGLALHGLESVTP